MLVLGRGPFIICKINAAKIHVFATKSVFFVHVCIFVPMPLDMAFAQFLKESILTDPDKRPELSSKQQRKAIREP